VYIGAAASLEAAWSALVQRWPSLTDVWLRFASTPIRHAGTMGGNVANGSPIGDSPPVLMALDAQIELRKGARVRRMPLTDFYLDYMKNQLEPGEFVQAWRCRCGHAAPGARLQDQQALRLRYLGAVRALPSSSMARSCNPCAWPLAAWPPRSSAAPGRSRPAGKPWSEENVKAARPRWPRISSP
jgi:xanthine dehydrogenase small subunit